MDEMKLKLSTKFMRNFIAKLISKTIYKKFGYKVDIQINDLAISIINGETKVSTNVEMSMNGEEFTKIVKNVGLED